MKGIEVIIEQIKGLDKESQKEIILNIQNHIESVQPSYITVKERLHSTEKNQCPHCSSFKVKKHDSYNSKTRFKCYNCNRTHTLLTGTVVHNIKKKAKFYEFLTLMFNSNHYPTIREISKVLHISIQTSFDWRHKILAALNGLECEDFSGITELDDVNVKYSQKGRKGLKYPRKRGGKAKKAGDSGFQTKVLMTVDRNKNMDFTVARIGRIKADDLHRILGNKLDKERNILVSDSHRSIVKFAKSMELHHETFIASEHGKGIYHVNNVNNLAQRFKKMVIDDYKGVATKYLQNYATYFRIKEMYKKVEDKVKEIFECMMVSNSSWKSFTGIERGYKVFIESYSERTYRCPVRERWSLDI